jgi:hypothetical protein
MNSEEIKLDITEQISKTNERLSNYWGIPWFDGILDEDIDSLKKVLKKATIYFKYHYYFSVVMSGFIMIIQLLQFLEITHKDMNKAGLAIGFTILFLLFTLRYYKVKVNLEHKIYLLGLRERLLQNA